MLSDLHFIRPWWLLAIPLGVVITALVWRVRDVRSAWRGIIAPHLLDALLVRGERRRRLLPVHLIAASVVIAPLALAGPTWQRVPSPFAEEQAALVIVVEATASMQAEDVAPSRAERAAQKIADLLERRPDTDTALIAYGGSAHVAMPLTRDTSIVAGFAAALGPDVMPLAGDAIGAAIALANEQLRRSGRSGSILLVSDGAPDGEVQAVDASSSVPVHVLAMVAGPAPASLESIAGSTGGTVQVVTPDDRDVARLADRARRELGRATDLDGDGQWRDLGYWFVPFLAGIALFWSRRGWAIAYAGPTGGES